MTYSRSTSSALAGLILIVVSACSDTTGSNGKTVSLSFSTKSKAAPAVAGVKNIGLLTQSDGTNTLVINTAQVVMSKIELTTDATMNCMDDSNDMDCEELKADPSLVDLPIDQNLVTSMLISSVPAGTYNAFEGKVHGVQSTDQGGPAFLMANPSFAGVSVHVEGTYNGVMFKCNSVATAELDLEFAAPIVVATSGLNITVSVSLASWFTNGSTLVDPTTGTCGGSTNAALVDHNISQSFEAFEDDNENGVDDNTEH